MVTTYFVPVEDKSLGAPRLVDPKTQSTITDRQANHVHRLFRTQVLGPSFACALGKNALANWRYRVGVYQNFDAGVGASVCEDLWSFVADQRALSANPDDFSTFITIFVTLDIPRDENEFESRLWTILQEIHDKDAHVYSWDPQTASDPDLPDFSFSVGEQSFFVVGQHAHSSRFSRRFPYPALAFNAHHQFERLRATGKFQKLQDVIRKQDIAIQGSINPSLTNYGADSEAKQYSGRLVPLGWKCPFQP
mgnify:CR=1 FL=1